MKNVYLVTGGAGGIGFGIAKQFTDGIVMLADISKDNLAQAKIELESRGVEVYTQVVDLSDEQSIEAMLQAAHDLGTIKTIVNSAGVSGDQASAHTLFNINLKGTQHLLEKAIDHMEAGSNIILISSMMGHSVPSDINYDDFLLYPEREGSIEKLVDIINDDSTLAYNFSKKGVHDLLKRYAYDYGKQGIRINSISPGIIKTSMSEKAQEEHPEQMNQLLAMTPMTRMGTVDDIANAAAFLASDKASFITGTDLKTDGGLIIKILESAQ